MHSLGMLEMPRTGSANAQILTAVKAAGAALLPVKELVRLVKA